MRADNIYITYYVHSCIHTYVRTYRQFLFRLKDVGRGKAEVAAEFITQRVPGCTVTPHVGRIQDFDTAFYRQFKVIISGLDNIEARRWLNSTLHDMVEYDEDGEPDPSSIIPLVDGGTEGFKGQVRIIVPKITSCFECSLESFPPQTAFPMCTIAETPRIPEHCIAYAFVLEWERAFPDKKLDKDSPADMQWVYERALARAQKFNIGGVTYFKTLGVVKNIIPAVASTNAIISAACVAEALKLLTFCSQTLNTYFMFMGSHGVYTSSFEYQKKDDCLVCSDSAVPMLFTLSGSSRLSDLIRALCESPSLQLKSPSIAGESSSLYMQKPPSLEAALRANLQKTLRELVHSGEVLTVTDPILGSTAVQVRLVLTE